MGRRNGLTPPHTIGSNLFHYLLTWGIHLNGRTVNTARQDATGATVRVTGGHFDATF